VLGVEGLRKAFGEHVVFPGIDLRVARGEKIGIIGKNGAGKTTLLKMLAGELRPDEGQITRGHKVKVGYYAQHHAETLSAGRTVFEEVAAANSRASATRVRTLLGSFLFHEEDVDKPIDVLSGGERARVALARILIDPGNVLLMDEPTNHLDLDSSEALAEALTTFDGTLVFVSHNRSFIRTLATRIWDVADGAVQTYPGTLDEYMDRHRDPERSEAAAEASPGPAGAKATGSGSKGGGEGRGKGKGKGKGKSKSKSKPARDQTKPAPPSASPKPAQTREQRKAKKREDARRRAERTRALGPLRKQVQQLEAEIEALEVKQREQNLALADPALYDDPKRRDALLAEVQRDSAQLGELTDAWELAQVQLEQAQVQLD
jgi:ATP-binding cassette subfamily F protein 3